MIDSLLIVLLAFILLDIASGLGKAFIKKNLNSKKMYKGGVKKAGIIAIVTLAYLLDIYVLNANGVVKTAVVIYYISNEGLSVLENLKAIGVPIPVIISKALEAMSKEE